MPFLNQQNGDNDRKKYFMINLYLTDRHNPKETDNLPKMSKCQYLFSGKNVIILLSAELAQKVVKVSYTVHQI